MLHNMKKTLKIKIMEKNFFVTFHKAQCFLQMFYCYFPFTEISVRIFLFWFFFVFSRLLGP